MCGPGRRLRMLFFGGQAVSQSFALFFSRSEEGFGGEGEVLPRTVFCTYLLFPARSSFVPSRRISLVLVPLAMRTGVAGCVRASGVALSTSSPSRRSMVTNRRPLWPLTDKFVVRLGGVRCSDTGLIVSYRGGRACDFYESAAGGVSG